MNAPSLDMDGWVNAAAPTEKEFRKAVHLILSAIESDPVLRAEMIMKGGILMALRFQSPRFTKDIDFSTHLTLPEIDLDDFRHRFESSLALQVAASEYDLDCKIQNFKVLPPKKPDAAFPSIRMTIGYAAKGTPKHRRLINGESPAIVSIDYSLNEMILAAEGLDIAGGSIQVYALTDLIAEKIRSLLQQKTRDRYRRQDVYDLNLLLIGQAPGAEQMETILESLIQKSRSRGIEPGPDSLSDPEVRHRAETDYHTLADEISGDLPDFSQSYTRIERFYKALPW